MSKNKSYIFFILLIVFSSIVFLEFIMLPWQYKLPRDLALMGFAAKPNTTLYGTAINSEGLTGDVISVKKESKNHRILTLGGSAIFIRSMTERLKDSLNSVSKSPVEVFGAALPTHNSMSSLIKYRLLSKYHFDYVIIYHAANDIFVNNVDAKHFKSDYSHMLPWYKRNFLLDHSLIARVIYNKLIWGRKIFGMEKIWYIFPTKEMENAMNFVSEDLFKRNIKELVEAIHKKGGVPILMTYAWNIPDNYTREGFKAGTLGYNNPDKLSPTAVELWGKQEFVELAMQKHNRVIRQIAKEYDLLLIDQENMMGNNLYWFGDVFHFSDEGTEQFIKNTTDFFLEHGLL